MQEKGQCPAKSLSRKREAFGLCGAGAPPAISARPCYAFLFLQPLYGNAVLLANAVASWSAGDRCLGTRPPGTRIRCRPVSPEEEQCRALGAVRSKDAGLYPPAARVLRRDPPRVHLLPGPSRHTFPAEML